VDDNVPAPPPLNVTARDTAVSFVVDDAAGGAPLSVSLGARITKAEGVHGPGVVVVPGGGDVSRDGRRQGDGVSTYPAAVDVARAWAEAFAGRGAVVLTYDKRTCGHNDDPQCTTNPQADVDAQGPVALARDVDAACALLRRDSDFDGRLVLLAHGQAGQVALASTCAASASAVVLLSPIPRSIDDVLVDAIAARAKAADDAARQTRNPDDKRARQAEAARLKNLGASRAASFSSMKSAKFSPTARVDGATIAFWLGWMKLTADTTSLASSVKERLVVVVGGRDRQLSPGDKTAAAALPAHRFLVVDDADHHLLVDGALSDAVTEPVFAAVDEILGTPGS
jgi:alpha-beta hydrolase superfamily lysophospholipase